MRFELFFGRDFHCVLAGNLDHSLGSLAPPVGSNTDQAGSSFFQSASDHFDLTSYQILLLFISNVLSLLSKGKPSSFLTSLSEKSMVSNWSRVAPRFSRTGIL